MIEKSHKVLIRVKEETLLPGEAEFINEHVRKLSAGSKGGRLYRGFTTEEEEKYLPLILNQNSTDAGWLKAVHDYWTNFSVQIPYAGKELEVGFRYKNEEDAVKGQEETELQYEEYLTYRKKGKYYYEKFDVRFKLGTPLNVHDYVIYRFALVSPRVARQKGDQNKSPRIDFIMENQTELLSTKLNRINLERKVSSAYEDIVGDNVVLGYMRDLYYSKLVNSKVSTSDEKEVKAGLYDLSRSEPRDFLEKYQDPDIAEKAFINRALTVNVLYQIPNTQIIKYDNEVLGTSLEETIVNLRKANNADIKAAIEARINETLNITHA